MAITFSVVTSRYRRQLGEELFMDGFRLINQRADMSRWASVLLETPPTGREWAWERLSGEPVFRNGVFGLPNGLRNHRAALEILAGDIERLQRALDERSVEDREG